MAENLKLPAIQSFYSNREGLVTLEDDVLSIVSRVRELYGQRVQIEVDPVTGWFHFVEYCGDGEIRLIFTVPSLDGEDVLDRLMRSDAHSRAYQDPYEAAEREQDSIQRRLDELARERVREGGEKLAHALKKDGAMPRLPMSVPITKGLPSA
jgi:hypothetical protein